MSLVYRFALGATAGLSSSDRRQDSLRARRAFTLIEMLVAMVITLVMLGIVVTVFGLVGDSVSGARAGMEMSDQLRAAKHRLQLDLVGVTTQMLPPRRPEYGEGYFEIIEGPVGRLPANTKAVYDETYDPSLPPTDPVNVAALHSDTTVADPDDMLMFTTRSKGEAFTGRYYDTTLVTPQTHSIQSQTAEVAWYVRGTTLYRRQLLVRPELVIAQPSVLPSPFYAINDISVRSAGVGYDLSPSPPPYYIAANSLEDLTRREARFMHAPALAGITPRFGWPHDVRGYGTYYSTQPYPYPATFPNPVPLLGSPLLGRLGLPTIHECSSSNWPLPGAADLCDPSLHQVVLLDASGNGTSSGSAMIEQFDAWDNPNAPPNAVISPNNFKISESIDPATGAQLYFDNTNRFAEDVLLTNVLSFDVRVWDPTAWIISQYDSLNNLVTYAPGDHGYPAAVYNYIYNGTATSLVSQGAYVDLNYYASFTAYVRSQNQNITGLSAGQIQMLATGTSTVPPLFQYPGSGTPPATFLQYGTPTPNKAFFGPGNPQSGLDAFLRTSAFTAYQYDTAGMEVIAPAVYDTGSWHYEEDGIDQNADSIADSGTNGLDDNGNGVVDEVAFVNPVTGNVDSELEAPPPYTAPLRGIQIKIRCFEPDSRQIREVTIVQEFVPE